MWVAERWQAGEWQLGYSSHRLTFADSLGLDYGGGDRTAPGLPPRNHKMRPLSHLPIKKSKS